MSPTLPLLLTALLQHAAAPLPAPPPAASAVPTAGARSAVAQRLAGDVEALASAKLKGRRAGTPEAEEAARHVADAFRKAGLLPGGVQGTYFQPFDFIDGVVLGPANAFATSGGAPVGRTWKVEEDFRPLAFSTAGSAETEVVFAGYGIAAKELQYDDYQGLDVAGKTVLVLRYGPDGDDPKSPFSPYLALRNKAALARDRGAKALLVATGPGTKDVADDLVALRTDASFSDSGLLAVSVKRPVAESLFAAAGKTLAEAQKAIDDAKKPASFPLAGARVTLKLDLTPRRLTTPNVLALVPGADPTKNTEFVVIGAHYDHLGVGAAGMSGSLDAEPAGKVHFGADDNASGVAALLEIARNAARQRGKWARSVLFVAFGAEELGTLGSLAFLKSPTVPAEKIVAMLNLDMVGRLRNDALDVHGVGTSSVWKTLLAAANTEAVVGVPFKLNVHEGGFGPSDHSPFYAAGKPVLFAFTGAHTDYHRSSDTADKLNYEGIDRVARLFGRILEGVATAEKAPDHVRVASAQPASASRGFRVWVGSIPDYSEDGKGVKLSGVSPGSPAEKAGLAGGDVIVKFGERDVKNIYDYTYALQDYKPGDVVAVVVDRAENGRTVRKTFSLTLGSRPSASK